jgi:hypothetical protein
MLSQILNNLYRSAFLTREPQSTTLSHGLVIQVAIKEDKCVLCLIRLYNKYPSEVELETVIKAWPYPVIARHPQRHEDGSRRITEVCLPVQGVLL